MTEKLDSETRREQIAAACLDVLGTRTVSELSMAEVARRVGLVPSALYRHFAGKDEMLDAVLDLIERRLHANLDAARAEAATSLERLRVLLVRHVRFVRENHAVPRLVFSPEMGGRNPRRRERLHGIVTGYVDRVAAIVREGRRAGELRADVDPRAAAMLLLGVVQPGALVWHLSGGRFDVTRHARQGWKLLRRAIAAGGGHANG